MLGEVVEPFSGLRTRRERDVEALGLPAVALGLVLLEAEGVQNIRQGQNAHAVRNAFLLDQRLFGPLTLPALLLGRRLGRLSRGAVARPCGRAMVGAICFAMFSACS